MRLARRLVHCSLCVVLVAVALAPVGASASPSGVVLVDLTVSRVAGATRFDTAVAAARQAFAGWSGVSHVVVANGEVSPPALALVAATAAASYDAPLLLVQRDRLPETVRTALAQIRSVNGTVTVIAVGGPTAIGSSCVAEIERITGRGTVKRPWVDADRFTVAADVAVDACVRSIEGTATVRRVLVANGEDHSGLYDALIAATLSASMRVPLLLVRASDVPDAVRDAMAELSPEEVIIVGGPGVVSDAVAASLRATARWSGATRYATAAVAFDEARRRGFVESDTVAIVSTAHDGLLAAACAGRTHAATLLTTRDALSPASAVRLSGSWAAVRFATVYGGRGAVSDEVVSELTGHPSTPTIITPRSGSLQARAARVRARVGMNTEQLHVYVDGRLVRTVPVESWTTVDLGICPMPRTGGSVRVVARGPGGRTSARSVTIERLAYPASTSIVIDKSDFRLYWVRDDILVASYPVAIGRVGMETPVAHWKVGAKYQTDRLSVYGPRKMRLFRRVVIGDTVRYVYTRYAIHGTNEPWVIGTKASHGCIRMYNRDVLALYPQVPLGTLVQTRE